MPRTVLTPPASEVRLLRSVARYSFCRATSEEMISPC